MIESTMRCQPARCRATAFRAALIAWTPMGLYFIASNKSPRRSRVSSPTRSTLAAY